MLAQTHIPLVRSWGGGEVASADGLRFVVPVRTVNAGPNPKYFGVGKGITYYNFTSDQFTGFSRDRDPWNAQGLHGYPGRTVGATDRAGAARDHDRHRGGAIARQPMVVHCRA